MMMFKRQAQTIRPVNPRYRAYGKARIDIAQRAQSRDDWQHLWKEPSNSFPFRWGENWKQCIEYKVDDFAAEVGFFIDILGFPVNAFDPDYAMFTSPGRDFYLSIVPAWEGEVSTPPDALRIQFMVDDIFETVDRLEGRSVVFEQLPQPCQADSNLFIAFFRTPHGICVDLWGFVDLDEEDMGSSAEVSEDFEDRLEDGEDDEYAEVEEDEVEETSPSQPVLQFRLKDYPPVETAEPESLDEDWDDEDKTEDNLEPKYVADDDEDEENGIWRVRYS
jgi:catechol 2,3-dioxygenase-like lactoylglutathione lyase family enzyme